MFSRPVRVATNLINSYPETDIIFSPDERYLLTGTSVKRGEAEGQIVCLNRTTLEPLYEIGTIHVIANLIIIRGY
jgi:hypothetical protein